MSGITRPLRDDEVERVWPTLQGSHAFASMSELSQYRAAEPWGVRVSDFGDALVVERWRAHLDALAVRALVAPPTRIAALADDACAVARSQGLATVLSPLALAPADEYVAAGMEPFEQLAGFTARVGSVLRAVGAGEEAGARGRRDDAGRCEQRFHLRPAAPEDLDALVKLEAECFDEFWREGRPELERDHDTCHRFTIAESADGEMLGYVSAASRGSSLTIGRLAVAAPARRFGIARALLADTDKWAAGRDFFGLSLCTQAANEAARSLYASSGFTEAPGRYLLLSRRAESAG